MRVIGAALLFLAGCNMEQADLGIRTEVATPKASEASATVVSSAEAIPSETVTDKAACFRLMEPADNEELPNEGLVIFGWEAIEGAASFQVQTQLPNGNEEYRNSDEAQLNRFMASLPLEGEYAWRVLAFDDGGEPICFSERFTFSKGE
jgi:hypothetical protein